MFTEDSVPWGGQGSDQENPHSPDGNVRHERASKQSRNADRFTVQPGQVLRQHAGAQEDLAR